MDSGTHQWMDATAIRTAALRTTGAAGPPVLAKKLGVKLPSMPCMRYGNRRGSSSLLTMPSTLFIVKWLYTIFASSVLQFQSIPTEIYFLLGKTHAFTGRNNPRGIHWQWLCTYVCYWIAAPHHLSSWNHSSCVVCRQCHRCRFPLGGEALVRFVGPVRPGIWLYCESAQNMVHCQGGPTFCQHRCADNFQG